MRSGPDGADRAEGVGALEVSGLMFQVRCFALTRKQVQFGGGKV